MRERERESERERVKRVKVGHLVWNKNSTNVFEVAPSGYKNRNKIR